VSSQSAALRGKDLGVGAAAVEAEDAWEMELLLMMGCGRGRGDIERRHYAIGPENCKPMADRLCQALK
jgi:hypothetical protein